MQNVEMQELEVNLRSFRMSVYEDEAGCWKLESEK